MTLGEYFEKLEQIVTENPELKGLKVLYTSDEKGNQFSEVLNGPVLAIADENLDIETFIDMFNFKKHQHEVNCVVIN